jgi:hypothetical protein
VCAQDLGFQNLPGVYGLEFVQRFCERRQDDPNALCSFHHMCIGDDVTIWIDDDARANGMPPGDSPGLVPVIFDGAITGDDDLDHGGGNFRDNRFKRAV